MKKLAFALCAAVLASMLTACVSTGGLSPSKVKKATQNGEWPSASDHALLFGYCEGWDDFLQQNPDLGYQFYEANYRTESHSFILFTIAESVEFLEPLPLGTELKLFSTEGYSGNTRTTTYYGIAGVDVVLTKPGLFFYGEDTAKHKYEKKALKLLYKYFKGTGSDWETLIVERMEELKNAK